MKRKRMIKLLMSQGIPRNEAVVYADACGPKLPHALLRFLLTAQPEIRDGVRPFLMRILQGTTFSMELEVPNE